MTGGSATGSALVPVSAFGPLNRLSLRVHKLANAARYEEALAAAKAYESVAHTFGDDKTVDFLLQSRMYAYLWMGNLPEAMVVGHELLQRHRVSGNVLGEAKTLADLAEAAVRSERLAEGMGYLARAGLLLEATTRRSVRYAAALGSYGSAAKFAGLLEVADAAFEQALRYCPRYGHAQGGYIEHQYLELLLPWGLRLDQLGHQQEAGIRFRRAATIAADWLAAHAEPDPADQTAEAYATRSLRWETVAVRALALAKLGDTDQAIALAESVIPLLRANDLQWGGWAAHLALGIALRARGNHPAARRELLATRAWRVRDDWPDDELIVTHELAILAPHTRADQASRDLLHALEIQSRLLWQLRLQRMAMLRQARGREELEIERAHAQVALLYDPLTGLGNRRRYDQHAAAINAGTAAQPTSLLVIDVDKFKAVNDTYSHAAGDAVLRQLGTILTAHSRAGQDTPIRYAGDEFVIFCRADLPTAVDIAERIRTAIAATDFHHIAPGLPVSVSVGVAQHQPGMTAADLFLTADTLLYRAKRDGRDRVAA